MLMASSVHGGESGTVYGGKKWRLLEFDLSNTKGPFFVLKDLQETNSVRLLLKMVWKIIFLFQPVESMALESSRVKNRFLHEVRKLQPLYTGVIIQMGPIFVEIKLDTHGRFEGFPEKNNALFGR